MRRAAPSTASAQHTASEAPFTYASHPSHRVSLRPQVVTQLPDEIILLSNKERNEITQSAYLVCVKEKDQQSCLAPACPYTSYRCPEAGRHCNRAQRLLRWQGEEIMLYMI